MLYLVATPIGNLADITFRAIDTLKSCEYILCEDTRRSSILLNHYEIKKALYSYHKFNETSKAQKILQDLRAGKNIALISDAGTPGISDPGTQLVQLCKQEGISVVSIPGPCAAIAALTCSGLSTDRFQFIGFLPKKSGELKTYLQEILSYSGTTICYESPNRLLEILSQVAEISPNRKLVIARELTKMHEEVLGGTAQELIKNWDDREVKGEIIVLIDGQGKDGEQDWSDLSPLEHVKQLQKTFNITPQEAIKLAASIRGVPKREIYNQVIKNDSD